MTENKEIVFDSSKGNVLSLLLDRTKLVDEYTGWHYVTIWTISSVIFFVVPLVICFLTQPSLLHRSASLRMPFLLDFAAYPMNLVVIPLLLTNALKERRSLNQILEKFLSGPACSRHLEVIGERFESFYGRYNPWSAIGAALAAIVFTYLWSLKFLNDQYITWHSFGTSLGAERLNAAGYYCVVIMQGLFWFLLAFTVLRSILHFIMFTFISKLSAKDIVVIPIHPDGCGGLKAVSHIVQLYKPLAFSIGLVVAGAYANDIFVFDKSPFDYLNILMIIGFIFFCVIAFFLPLWPFSRQMRESKKRTLETISDLFLTLWTAEFGHVNKVNYKKIDFEALQHVSALYHVADQMPVWPYDLKTVKSFMSYVIVPLITIIVSALIRKLIG